MILTDYLRDAMRRPHAWGEFDCCTFSVDWAVLQGHDDPMQAWRGRYRTAARAMALIRRDGGLVQMFTVGCAMSGLPEVDEPRRGDIGVVQAPTDDGSPHVGGIFTGKRWALLAAPKGLLMIETVAVRCWRVGSRYDVLGNDSEGRCA